MKKFMTNMFLMLAMLSFGASADMAQQVNVDKPYARAALKVQGNSICFMDLINLGEDTAVVNATSSTAKIVELHTHVNDNGVLRMRKIDRIDLPANQTVALKPGGLHVMLIGLTRDLKVDDYIDLGLEFEDGSVKSMQIPVRRR
jgi:copper(I)-binding protein